MVEVRYALDTVKRPVSGSVWTCVVQVYLKLLQLVGTWGFLARKNSVLVMTAALVSLGIWIN